MQRQQQGRETTQHKAAATNSTERLQCEQRHQAYHLQQIKLLKQLQYKAKWTMRRWQMPLGDIRLTLTLTLD